MKPGEAELAARLRAHGYKLTRQRRAVLGVLVKGTEHLSPAEVYERAKADCPQIGLTTVYRTLELLGSLGLIKRVHLDKGCHSYALASQGHCHHLICDSCGSVVEFEGCDLSPLLEAVAEQTGFVIKRHWLELFGRCPSCQEKEEEQ